MERVLLLLAFIAALAIGTVAAIELDSRSSDGGLAIPTLVPSPYSPAGPTRPPKSTRLPAPTPRKPAGAVTSPAVTPASSRVGTPAPTSAPDRTAAPPRTPTPEPALTPGPTDASRGETPHTGGGAVPNGLVIAGIALALRAGMYARRRSY